MQMTQLGHRESKLLAQSLTGRLEKNKELISTPYEKSAQYLLQNPLCVGVLTDQAIVYLSVVFQGFLLYPYFPVSGK